MSGHSKRIAAPHVQAAIQAGLGVGQAKIESGQGPSGATHVQAAISGAMQARTPVTGQGLRLSPHVQMAVDSVMRLRSQASNSRGTIQRAAAFDLDSETRPSFRDEVKEYFLKQFRAANNPISGQPERWYQCASCSGWKQYEAIQLGHKIGWKDWARARGVTSRTELINEYNNIANLQLECSLCNGSHDFERGAGGEFMD